MWFKNLLLYRLEGVKGDAVKWGQVLSSQMFVPPSSNEMARSGWDRPRGADGALVHCVNRQLLLMLATEKKVIPAGAVKLVLAQRVAEIEKAQGFAPGKKARQEIKERVIDEMLPTALRTRTETRVWVDPVNGWLAVDTAAPARADEALKFLLKAFNKFPVESLRVQRSPIARMTAWLADADIGAPDGFTVDQDATMRAAGESKAQVQYKRHTLGGAEVRDHIKAGKQCTQLALTWDSKISFVLTGSLAIKSIKPLDVMGLDERSKTEDADERFDSDFMLMTGEYNRMLRDLVTALGGEAKA